MQGAYTLAIRERGDAYCACLSVKLGKDVAIDVKASVSTSAVASLLNRTFRGTFGGVAAGSVPEAEMVGFFGKIFRAVKKVAKSVARSKVFRAARGVFRSPIFKGIATAIPGVNVAVGALTAADMAIQAADGVSKMIRGGKGRRGVQVARARARVIKRRAALQARRRRVPFPTFQRAWRSGWGSVPDPRLVAAIRRYRGPQNPRAMFRAALPQMTRGYAAALPGFMAQYA